MQCANYGQWKWYIIGVNTSIRSHPEATFALTGHMSRIHVDTLRNTKVSGVSCLSPLLILNISDHLIKNCLACLSACRIQSPASLFTCILHHLHPGRTDR